MAIGVGEREQRALVTLNGNRGESRHTTPTGSKGHYPGWFKWDGDFTAIVRARFGDPDGARQELLAEAENVDRRGFIPNMVTYGTHRWWDLEPKTFLDPNKSSYSQPPVFALAALETYQSFTQAGREDEGRAFLEEIYPAVSAHFKYFMLYREMGPDNPLIFNTHPHETGRDYDPTFDANFGGFRLRVSWKDIKLPPLNKVRRLINAASAYVHRLWMGNELRKEGWTEEAGKKFCGVQDVMFNAIYAHGLGVLSDIATTLGKDQEAIEFRTKEEATSGAILDRMWDSNDGVFKALDREGRMINTISVSNLFPIILRDIRRDQIVRILDDLKDPNRFGTPFPIPSVPMGDHNFDGHYEAPLIWRGTTWPPMNFYIVDRGLVPQALSREIDDPDLARRLYLEAAVIADRSAQMADNGYSEQKNPITGLAVRPKTSQNFSWGTLLELLAVKRRFLLEKLQVRQ